MSFMYASDASTSAELTDEHTESGVDDQQKTALLPTNFEPKRHDATRDTSNDKSSDHMQTSATTGLNITVSDGGSKMLNQNSVSTDFIVSPNEHNTSSESQQSPTPPTHFIHVTSQSNWSTVSTPPAIGDSMNSPLMQTSTTDNLNTVMSGDGTETMYQNSVPPTYDTTKPISLSSSNGPSESSEAEQNTTPSISVPNTVSFATFAKLHKRMRWNVIGFTITVTVSKEFLYIFCYKPFQDTSDADSSSDIKASTVLENSSGSMSVHYSVKHESTTFTPTSLDDFAAIFFSIYREIDYMNQKMFSPFIFFSFCHLCT